MRRTRSGSPWWMESRMLCRAFSRLEISGCCSTPLAAQMHHGSVAWVITVIKRTRQWRATRNLQRSSLRASLMTCATSSQRSAVAPAPGARVLLRQERQQLRQQLHRCPLRSPHQHPHRHRHLQPRWHQCQSLHHLQPRVCPLVIAARMLGAIRKLMPSTAKWRRVHAHLRSALHCQKRGLQLHLHQRQRRLHQPLRLRQHQQEQ